MIVSMTGYGRASGDQADLAWIVEIRSVNHRFLKLEMHLPDALAGEEPAIEQLLRQQLGRGCVTVTVTVTPGETAAATVNLPVVRSYLRQLLDLAGAVDAEAAGQSPATLTIDLAQLLTLPGACQAPAAQEHRHQQHDFLLKLVRDALEQLLRMRRDEGEALWRDLQQHLDGIGEAIRNIRVLAAAVAQQYHERLRARVRQLVQESGVAFNDADLLREVALFAERADINEELARLQGHLDHFVQLNQSGQPRIGRTLDFIGQEMLREANTIGGKCADGQIARWTLRIKGLIDRLKEQVQNVE